MFNILKNELTRIKKIIADRTEIDTAAVDRYIIEINLLLNLATKAQIKKVINDPEAEALKAAGIKIKKSLVSK